MRGILRQFQPANLPSSRFCPCHSYHIAINLIKTRPSYYNCLTCARVYWEPQARVAQVCIQRLTRDTRLYCTVKVLGMDGNDLVHLQKIERNTSLTKDKRKPTARCPVSTRAGEDKTGARAAPRLYPYPGSCHPAFEARASAKGDNRATVHVAKTHCRCDLGRRGGKHNCKTADGARRRDEAYSSPMLFRTPRSSLLATFFSCCVFFSGFIRFLSLLCQ